MPELIDSALTLDELCNTWSFDGNLISKVMSVNYDLAVLPAIAKESA